MCVFDCFVHRLATHATKRRQWVRGNSQVLNCIKCVAYASVQPFHCICVHWTHHVPEPRCPMCVCIIASCTIWMTCGRLELSWDFGLSSENNVNGLFTRSFHWVRPIPTRTHLPPTNVERFLFSSFSTNYFRICQFVVSIFVKKAPETEEIWTRR